MGPNAKKGKGSVSRLPSLSDASTKPFRKEKNPFDSRLTPLKGRQLGQASLKYLTLHLGYQDFETINHNCCNFSDFSFLCVWVFLSCRELKFEIQEATRMIVLLWTLRRHCDLSPYEREDLLVLVFLCVEFNDGFFLINTRKIETKPNSVPFLSVTKCAPTFKKKKKRKNKKKNT